MIVLKKLEIKDFRKINNLTFSPEESKITGIIGANGAGKSTLLIALKWCLFGVTPEGVTKSELRRDNMDLSKEVTYVEAEILHEGEIVKIRREIKGKNSTTTAFVWVDGILETKVSVGATATWVKKRLGFGLDMFNTSFVIGQKELDNLIKLKATARRALIEKLTGVEKLSKALTGARDELKASKRALDSHEVTYQHIEALEEAVEAAKKAMDTAQTDRDGLSGQLNALKDNADKAFEKLQTALKLFEDKKNKEKEITALEDTLRLSAKAADDLEDMIAEHISQYGDKAPEDMGAVEAEYTAAQSYVSKIKDSVSTGKNKISNLSEKIESLEKRIKELEYASDYLSKEALDDKLENLTSEKAAFETDISVKDKLISDKKDALAAARANLVSTKDIMASISKHSHDEGSTCPTCGNSISNPEEIAAKLQNKEKYESDMVKALAEEISTISDERSKASDQLRTTEEQIQKFESKLSSFLQISDVNEELKTEKISIEGAEATLREDEESLVRAEEALKEISKVYHNAENQHATYNTLLLLRKRKENADDENRRAAEKVKSARDQLDMIDAPSISEGQRLREIFEAAKDVYEKEQAKDNASKDLYNEAKIILAENNVRLTAAKEAYARKEAAIEKVSHITSAVDLIASYRKDYLAKLAPELADEATTLISHMTQGRYIEIILDENFTPSVVDSEGNIRPAAWLSGGEESAVALALRMAVGSIASQGGGGLLWLDEVLVSQDEGRRASILTTLREQGRGRQVVIINHSPEAVENVDAIYEVTQSADGSTLNKRTIDELSDIDFEVISE